MREARVPAALVERLSTLQSEGFTAWIRAKAEDRWDLFAPVLQQLLDASIERARAIDPVGHPYDTLLQEFDPGTTVASLQAMFTRLQAGLTGLLRAIAARPALPERPIALASARQLPLHREVTAALGYDYAAGRLDFAEHPFSITLGTGDVRITTHLHDDDLLGGLSGSVHEAGHALYEQGLPRDKVGWGVENAASMGLHESQSRFWENWIGRSRPFLGWLATRLTVHAPELGAETDALYAEANRVKPGLIRIYADEVTYNLHIVVRFELELALFEGRLAVADLPAAWRAKYEEYLGVSPATDREGVLQDVHWSGAAFGYFPSYTLGNLYAASLARAIETAVPDLWTAVGEGRFAPVLAWLRENVHRHGHTWDAPELVARAVGERDAVADLLDHLWARHGALYGATR
ncbi:MAG: carboxypeptidase M32 [Deltaproteobacteria bacterium]|nr:carboxypeptidase M32 [Deltaproteobacteria bacterium]